ncbi:MAG: segregation/condensation protein A [Pseudomonadota bacterium]
MSLTVKLEIYEGPLDLLLHLIKKNEVDIYDIPIALITTQYLDYLQLMDSFNIEVAGEFLLMASALVQIKSRMLLPSLGDQEETEEEDPRLAIVRPLLEYMKIKDAAETLERREILDRDVFARAAPADGDEPGPGEEEAMEASLFDLIEAFRRLAVQVEVFSTLEFRLETKTIKQRILEILRHLRANRESSFRELCRTDRAKAELILSFLAVLELARVGRLRIYQPASGADLKIFYENNPLFEGNDDEDDDENILEKMGLGESWD